jgi:hypothetical protein
MRNSKLFFKGFKKGMKQFSDNISLIINSILLSIVYLLGVGITSIFAKLSGKHFLDLKLSKKKKSYWSSLNLKKKPIENYYRQF